jgi:putative membrane protein
MPVPSLTRTLAAGVTGGLVASLAMNLFQRVAAPAFGQGGSNDDPATVKAADSVTRRVTGEAVTQKHRETAGSLVHYATGAALGAGYALAARRWPQTTAGFGLAYGVAIATLLDDAAVPAFGWGPAPTDTPPATHAYGLASHAVFGLALEGTRRGIEAALD